MSTKLRKKTLVVVLLLGFLFTPYQQNFDRVEGNPGPFFSISLLAPNSAYPRNQWASLMVEQLPKIGIEIDVFDHTGWAQISPRTWSHPGPYPVPSYAEGGFDILFVSWGWGLDWDPTGLYDSPAITPNGDNFYQYNNPAMDAAISSYTSSFTLADRIKNIGEIQTILYEDLPQIAIINRLLCYPHDPNVTDFEALLWASSYYPFHKLSIADQTAFHYATPADFEDFHMHSYESNYDAQWLKQIYSGLVQRNPNLQNFYSPWIAESFASNDGITYQVIIKDNACWADGTDLTTDDVIYNYNLTVTPALGGSSYYRNSLYWDNNSITKINDKEFSIEFLQPYVFQEGNLALNLIPEHIWGTIDPADHQSQAIDWAKDNPENIFGAGPYMLHEYDPTNSIIHLVANPHFVDWYGTEPSFEDIYFEFYGSKENALSALVSGSIDMIDCQYSPQIDELDLPDVDFTLCDDDGVSEMGFNMEHPILGTGELCPIAGAESAKHIRKAISHMVPRDIIVDEILNGLGRPGVTGCPRAAVGYNHSLVPYEYNIELAKYHIGQAGYDISYTLTKYQGSFVISLSFPFIVLVFGLLGACIWIIRKKINL